MEPILLYGVPAGSSMGLVAAFERAGLPYRLCRVDMLRDMKTSAFARLNGRQETPALITPDGRVLTETLAIAAWLEARDTDRRVSFDPLAPEADRMRQLAAFVNTGFTAAFSPLWQAMESPDADPATLDILRGLGRRAVARRHAQLEAMIAPSPFLAGDHLTLADTTLIGVARWAEFHQVDEPTAWPKLTALRRRIEADPAVRFAQSIENGDTPVGCGAFQGHIPLEDLLARFAA